MSAKFRIYNATELWQRETSLPSIPTFSQALDNILGSDGIQLGSITELLGLPGSGKTQLWYENNEDVLTLNLQLCASVQTPEVLGGLNAEALFIDTNTNFNIKRFREILLASLKKCQGIVQFERSEEEALKKLHYVNAFGLERFCAFLHKLPQYLLERPCIRLIVIDSIVFPFKEGITARERTGLLFRQMADLQKAAFEKMIAVVLTNEMSTRIGLCGGGVVGALGDAWAHRCNVQLLLSARDVTRAERDALLLKSPLAPSSVATFQITKEGIRDVG